MAQSHASARSFTRGEIARRTGCNLETIRYYEKAGLLPEPPRAANGYRIYDAAHERRLRFILRGRALGFDIVEIRGLLALMDGGDQTCAEVRARTNRHIADIQRKIADLRRMERVLKDVAAKCDGGDVPECPIVDALSA